MQRQAEAARERGRLLHQLPRHRERGAGATASCTRARALLVELAREPLGVGEHGVEVLDGARRAEAAVRLAEVHRAARGDDADAELARRLHLRLDEPGPPRGKT